VKREIVDAVPDVEVTVVPSKNAGSFEIACGDKLIFSKLKTESKYFMEGYFLHRNFYTKFFDQIHQTFFTVKFGFFTTNFDSQKTNLFLAFPVVEDIIEQIQYASEGFTPEEVTTKGEKASCVIM